MKRQRSSNSRNNFEKEQHWRTLTSNLKYKLSLHFHPSSGIPLLSLPSGRWPQSHPPLDGLTCQWLPPRSLCEQHLPKACGVLLPLTLVSFSLSSPQLHLNSYDVTTQMNLKDVKSCTSHDFIYMPRPEKNTHRVWKTDGYFLQVGCVSEGRLQTGRKGVLGWSICWAGVTTAQL